MAIGLISDLNLLRSSLVSQISARPAFAKLKTPPALMLCASTIAGGAPPSLAAGNSKQPVLFIFCLPCPPRLYWFAGLTSLPNQPARGPGSFGEPRGFFLFCHPLFQATYSALKAVLASSSEGARL